MIQLIYRKSRKTGNFSIETSFDYFLAYYQKIGQYQPIQKVVSSYYSKGILPRLQAIFEMKKSKGQIFHVTGDVHYLCLGLPKEKTILTIHDLGFMQQKTGLVRAFLKYFWITLPVRHCRYVTTVSEATRQDVLRYSNCASNKIKVIPTLINPVFQQKDKTFKQEKPTILHIGTAFNKNLERHIKAIAGLKVQLHIIGQLNKEQLELLSTYKIDFTNDYNISEEEIKQAYEQADILLFCSTLEGFGMPIIEAQKVGRVVITSNLSSMPEIAGEGACLVNPFSIDAIRKGVIKVIENTTYRKDLIHKGYKNCQKYAVEKVTAGYEQLYAQILEETCTS